MTWTCAAIDHGMTIFPNGKIGPCCQIDSSYLKPLDDITKTSPFSDLKSSDPPSACRKCVENEHNGISSYRQFFNQRNTGREGIQFLDIRNSNFCNLKCRYCGPHFSNQWGVELEVPNPLMNTDVDKYLDTLLTDCLHLIYFTGGEPIISKDHWTILDNLIETKKSKKISLLYNSNLSTLTVKGRDILEVWKHFDSVYLQVSIDAIGQPLEYIRSGSDWSKIQKNIFSIIENKSSNTSIALTPVVSLLNIWFLDDLCNFAKKYNIPMNPIVLQGPDYLALDVVPDEYKTTIMDIIQKIEEKQIVDSSIISHMRSLVNNNINQCLIQHFLSHVMLLDKMRNEKLFDLLPFSKLSKQLFLENHEYQ